MASFFLFRTVRTAQGSARNSNSVSWCDSVHQDSRQASLFDVIAWKILSNKRQCLRQFPSTNNFDLNEWMMIKDWLQPFFMFLFTFHLGKWLELKCILCGDCISKYYRNFEKRTRTLSRHVISRYMQYVAKCVPIFS